MRAATEQERTDWLISLWRATNGERKSSDERNTYLNLSLDVLDRIRRLDIQGDGFAREGLDENLHSHGSACWGHGAERVQKEQRDEKKRVKAKEKEEKKKKQNKDDNTSSTGMSVAMERPYDEKK